MIASTPKSWLDGSSVSAPLAEEDGLDAMPIPPETETHEEFLESLRQELADIQAGIRGIPLEEAFAQIAAELNLPKVPRE